VTSNISWRQRLFWVKVFFWQTNVLLTLRLTSVIGLSTCTQNACRLLSHNSNVDMCCTTKTNLHATLTFQQFGQKIRKCFLHTGSPQFRQANLVLFRCDGWHIWQSFLAVSGSWTCGGTADVKSGNVLYDSGPHSRRQHWELARRFCAKSLIKLIASFF